MTNQPTEPKQPNKRGKKTELTPELEKQIVDLISTGNTFIKTVCDYVGIAEETFYEWIRRGEGRHSTRPENELYAKFAQSVKKSKSIAEVASVARIRQAGTGGKPITTKKITKYAKTGEVSQITEETTLQAPNWQADAWYLERSYPDRWGRTRTDVHIFDKMTDEQLRAFIKGETNSPG